MEVESFIASLKERLRGFIFPLIIACIGLVLIVYGLIVSLGQNNDKKEDIVFEQGKESSQQTLNATTKNVSPDSIFVDISGAVLKPGVYSLALDARVEDAVLKAGGLTEDANREEIARSINLAAKVVDGEKIYIPFSGETISGVLGESTKVSINKASSSDFDKLPGIGPVTAEKIIANRPYQKIEDLLSRKVVSQSVFEKIKEKVGL